MKTFQEVLRQERLAKGMTQEELSLATAEGGTVKPIAVSTIAKLEQGNVDPTLPTADRIAQALGISMELFSGLISARGKRRRVKV